ncbi:hypothetical protein K493DRAFT_313336 [Basidiobolus meristosporus CBS 931.73]|uniref:Uncharacterized protein n=1 Tax=Basidiobolus meristosporus CBS 931.73 TaxID=1314790 RepID=A0A1Y1YM69_9FUNG|nr:hypothetical protein K493DRAFT_313336 [Basidiobolus meristosporus CBS 931.73]|eukprot:ORX99095.1 hypothetical protein K493DRAFT_313336 [Basidiobolus meristosporus CBS 931.73]
MKFYSVLAIFALSSVTIEGQIFRPIVSVEGTDGRTSLPFQDLVRDITGTFFLPNAVADIFSKPVIFAAATAANVLKTAGCLIGFCRYRSGSQKTVDPPKKQ